VANQDEYARQLLTGIASGKAVSQRSMARELGIALGLTNLLMRRLARKGWIRIVKVKPNRLLYFITPAGIAEKARMSREYFQRSVSFYVETRDRIRQSFDLLTAAEDGGGNGRVERIVFLGAGEVAEIGYLCLAETGLELVGVVDDERVRPFFGVNVRRMEELTPEHIAGRPYDRLAVMSFGEPQDIRARLAGLGIPDGKIHWLDTHV
jgi:DNA-binding PadR family transcriptional regulator